MEGAESSRYVAQLKAEFDSCDSTCSGFLDRLELTELCRKLQLDAHLPLLLDTLLGGRSYARVNFEEFKDGFVAVLSRSLDFSTSEDDSSYLQPVVPEEVKPKFVKGTKRYGRRSRPDSQSDAALTCDSEDSPPSRTEASDSSPAGVRRAKLRRSTSLESVESLKSDEEAGSPKSIPPDCQSKGGQEEEEEQQGGRGGAVGGARGGGGAFEPGLQELDVLDNRVSLRDFQKVLCGSAPVSCSTPVRGADLQRAPPHTRRHSDLQRAPPHTLRHSDLQRAPPHTRRHSDLQRAPPHTLRHSDLQRAPHTAQVLLEERSVRSTSPSLLTATVGQKVLSRLDDGSGCTSPDRVIGLWTEEGIRNSRDILQTLDFSLEERLSLADLTLALDNELLVSGNGIQQAALISYKNELQHLQVAAEQACRERDKVKSDLDLADQRNLQLVREVDDRHASMETLNQSRIRDLEQDFRDRLTALRSQSEQESEALLQQVERERSTLQEELQLLRVQEAQLQEELCSAAQDNGRLEDELSAVKLKLAEAQSSVTRLQRDLDQLLQDKFGSLDPAGAGLSHEERFTELIREYELRCRELRDRNDELSSELELLKSQKSDKKTRRSDTLSWKQQQQQHCDNTESDSDDSDMQRSSSPRVRKKLQPADKTALSSLDGVSGPSVSIQTELALEQLKQKHKQELQQLHIQLETQVNYYERSQELMKQSMEVERKDICSAFKLEISELEEQKAAAEQQVKQLKEVMEKLQTQIQHGGGGGGRWSSEQERRMQRERAELEQNFARELSNLVQRLSSEKDQLEAELRLQMDQELLLVREEAQEEAQQQLSHMKLQHADAQQRLLQELQEQRAFWENRLVQSEQEKLQREEQTRICSEFSTERRRRKEEQQELIHTSSLSISQSEASYLIPERSCVEEQLQEEEQQEEQQQQEQLQEEQQQEAKDQTISALRCELEVLQEATRSKEGRVSRLTAELDSMRTDRARLIQDLKEQAMAVDHLRLELDSVSEELSRRRSAEESLQEVLRQEQTRTRQLRSGLQEEREEVVRLSQEVQSYTRLVNQLSTQIVEMEEEITSLRDHLRDLSAQLNDTADLVLDLRTQLNSRSGEANRLRDAGEVRLLQRALQDSRDQLRSTEEDFEREKRRMTQQLLELETLVLDLEEVMDPSSPHRTQLEEVRSDNGALQERLTVLQQEVTSLEDDVARKRRKLEDMEQDHKRSREEEERLHKENCRYREEVLDLSSRNLQLSNDNAELSARLHGDQESVRVLQERLATVTKEQEEEGATVRRLQDEALQQQAAWTQQQAAWSQQTQQLERELSCCREKLARLCELEEELSSVTLKHQRLEENENQLLRDEDAQNAKVEQLQQAVLSLQTEAELLRSQLLAVTQEKVGHAQEVTDVHRKLQDAQNKVEQLEVSIRRLMKEKEELQQVREQQEQQEQQASVTQQEETHKLIVQNQELQHKLAELQVQSLETQKLIQEQQKLKTKRNQLETARAQDQVQQLQELQTRLQKEQRRSQQLEEALRLQAQQSCSQISIKQGQYEKAVAALQQRMDELEAKLKAVRVVLQEKVEQLKEQMVKNRKLSMQLQEVYVETGQLMKALQVTEQRQKHAEKKNFLLEEKMTALNNVLRDVVQAALAT
ncbi:ninein-like protein [Scomber scombrus]|uniref:ninein-like protein n=1 Tax=Scomber scombrus TaxID=13677 RepID=UPI002DD80B4D|nr:ninein-like protein [Scomber scombrus]